MFIPLQLEMFAGDVANWHYILTHHISYRKYGPIVSIVLTSTIKYTFFNIHKSGLKLR